MNVPSPDNLLKERLETPLVCVDKFMTCHTQNDQVGHFMGATLRAVLDVMQVQYIFGATEPAPMAVGLESPLADIVRDIGRSGNFRLADPGFLLFLVLMGVHVFI